MVQGLLDKFITVDLLSYFLFQPVLHNWCNKGHTVSGRVHINDSLLLIEKRN